MDSNTGRFIGPDEYRRAAEPGRIRISKMPTLELGEIVEVKGVKFRVKKIKPNGHLAMQMVIEAATA